MDMRVSRKTVTFAKCFSLKGLDGEQEPGTYIVVTEEERIPGLLFTAWRRVETTMRVPSVESAKAYEQVVTIDPEELTEALARDAA
jgi:hypothetical protein